MNLDGTTVSIGIFLLSHLGAAIWFGSSMKSDIRHMSAKLDELRKDLHQIAELATLNRTNTVGLETRVTNLEIRVDKLERRVENLP